MSPKLFKSSELIQLHKNGNMDSILKQYSKYITVSNRLGQGGDASVFDYNKNTVLKVCHKKIKYFSNFPEYETSHDFASHINQLGPYFLPIEEILYDDPDLMVYTQKKCKILTKKMVDRSNILDIFKTVQFMIKNNTIISDIAPHNWGVIDGKTSLIDYHGLTQFRINNGIIRSAHWWQRIARNLVRYMAIIYVPNLQKELLKHMIKYNKHTIDYLKNESGLPAEFIKLIEYMYDLNGKNIPQDKVCELFDSCIKIIKKTKKQHQ
jgi:hypothetical protein